MSGLGSRRFRVVGIAALAGLAIAAGGVAPVWRDVTLTNADGARVTIGAIRLGASPIGAAFAQDAQTIALENVVLELGLSTYRLPRIEFAGTSLGRAELLSLFDGKASEPLAARLARLTARQVSAPEIIVEQQIGPERQTIRYRNVAATGLVQGRVASIVAETAALETKGGRAGAVAGTLGRLTIADLDLGEAMRVYAERRNGPPGELARIYGAFTLENVDLRTDKAVEIKVSRIGGRDFLARPTAGSLSDSMKVLGAADNPDKASPAEQAKLLGAAIEVLDAMAVGSLEAVGIDIRDPTDSNEATGRIARIAYTAGAGVQAADARIEGLEIVAKDGRARIASIAFTGFGFGATVDGLKDLAGRPSADPDPAVLRRLIPTIGTVRLAGLDFDVPNESAKGPRRQNMRFAVKDIEVTADKPLNGIPTNLRLAVDHLTFTVPSGSTEEGLKDLAAMGYGAVDLSWTTAASWTEPGNELVIREVSMRGSDMGSLMLRGVLGNVSRDVFHPDSAVALVALIGATAKNLDVTVVNQGLFERVIAREAKNDRAAGEKLRREYGMAAAVAVPTMLGNSAQAKTIGQAVARFIAKPGRLTLSARTKEAGGLGVADLALLDQPAAILDRLDITATAE